MGLLYTDNVKTGPGQEILVLIAYVQNSPLNVYVDAVSWAIGSTFILSLHLYPNLVFTRSEGSGAYAQSRLSIPTRRCDKFLNFARMLDHPIKLRPMTLALSSLETF